jgi:ferredoxin-NADP reductase
MSTFAARGAVRFPGQDAPETLNCINTDAAGMTLKVRDVYPATPRTRIIRLDLAGKRFDYQPGQAVFVGPRNEKAALYSLTLPPEESHSTDCLELLGRVGQPDNDLINLASGVVQVAGPVGKFTLPTELAAHRRLVFVAGGTGIAPVRSMLRRALHLPGCSVELLYSARAPEEFPYESELLSLARAGRIKLWQTVTREAAINGWAGGRGRIGAAVLEPIAADPDALFFICGPLSLVNGTQQILERVGVAPERIRIDRW